MSFLKEIRNKKTSLSHTRTTTTDSDGRVFEEDLREGSRKRISTRYGFVVDTKPDLTVTHVLPGLLMGSQDVALSEDILRLHSVTHVLSVGVEVPKIEGINFTYVQALDLPEFNLKGILEQCFALIDAVREENNLILIHCNAGVSRSASIVIGYIMRECSMAFQTSYDYLKIMRPSISPNPGFVKQLISYGEELAHHDKSSSSSNSDCSDFRAGE